MSKIQNALLQNDRETIRCIAHSLKGSAGNIGADHLRKAAYALESAAKTEKPESLVQVSDLNQHLSSDLNSPVANFERALNEVLQSLNTLKQSCQKPESPSHVQQGKAWQISEAEAARIFPLIGQIFESLNVADPVEIQKQMEKLKLHLVHPTLDELEDHIANYEYDAARQTLLKISRELGLGRPTGF